jgi:hypothetical protein
VNLEDLDRWLRAVMAADETLLRDQLARARNAAPGTASLPPAWIANMATGLARLEADRARLDTMDEAELRAFAAENYSDRPGYSTE